MTQTSSCPDRDKLRRLLAGTLHDVEAERVEEHLKDCQRCADTVHGLQVSDTLVDAVRRSRAPAPEAIATLGELMNRLAKLPEARETMVPSAPLPADPAEWSRALSLRPAERPDELGRLGGFRILNYLGDGCMGVVFLAEDEQLRRRVALKIMKPQMAVRGDARERFLREARAAAALKDDHIITIYHVGEDNGVPYFASELLEGRTLEQWLAANARPGVRDIVRLGREIARGLEAAHDQGLIHRDVKPANVWLETLGSGASSQGSRGAGQPGRVKILDFGLVRPVEEDAGLTASGMILGTPHYMSPEQARGDPLDGRSDLFSLGCILYRLGTGQLPFPGNNIMALLNALATETPAPPRHLNPDLPQPLADLIEELLWKEPGERPASARVVADRLRALEQTLDAGLPAKTFWCRRRIRVTVKGPDGVPRVIHVNKPFARIGSHADADVVLPDGNLPPLCLYLHATNEGIYCLGLDPSGESKLFKNAWLRPNSRARVGPYRISAAFDDEGPLAAGKLPDPRARDSISGPALHLRIASRDQEQPALDRTWRRRLTLVGRQAPSKLRLIHPTVSKVHCVLYWDGQSLWAVDLLSANGTRLAGQRIDCLRLKSGQTLEFGQLLLTYLGVVEESPSDEEHPASERLRAEELVARIVQLERERDQLHSELAAAGQREQEQKARATELEAAGQKAEEERRKLQAAFHEQAAQLTRAQARCAEIETRHRIAQQESAGQLDRLQAELAKAAER